MMTEYGEISQRSAFRKEEKEGTEARKERKYFKGCSYQFESARYM